jgi:hypothetical protein
MIVQVLWCLVSTANSIDPTASLKKMFSEVVEYYLLYFVLFRSITSTETIRKILYAVVLAMMLASFFGTIESYSNWRILDYFPENSTGFITANDEQTGRGARVESIFPHPILFAAAIATVLPMALYLVSVAKEKSQRIILWSGLLLMFLSLYKTQSRGPWMAAMLSVGLYMPWGGKKIRKYLLIIGILCAAVMMVRPGVYDTIADMYTATVDPNSPMGASYQYRYALKDVATEALGRSPGRSLWGYGMESFFALHLTGPFLGKLDHPFISCDSAWMEVAVETGYVGLGLFVLLMLIPAHKAFRGLFKLPEEYRCLSSMFFACMAGYYFMMMSVALYAWGQNGYMLWMIIGMSLSLASVVKQAQPVALEEPAKGSSLARKLGARPAISRYHPV